MSLKEYFENTKGFGVLATADAEGNVDAAVYARPHMTDDDTAAFIMRDRLSHRNLKSNPHALFLFHEDGPGYAGRRLHLTLEREETDPEKIRALRRRALCPADAADEEATRFFVTFRVDRVRPLVGDGEAG
jgi:hypothetical protein